MLTGNLNILVMAIVILIVIVSTFKVGAVILGNDEEYYCQDQAQATVSPGMATNDWANAGKQTNPSYYRLIEETGTGATLTGQYSDRQIDTNSDGLFEQMAIDIEVSVSAPGSYTLFGNLYDSNDKMFWSEIFVNLEVGEQTVSLVFDGTELRENRVEGPYYLKSLFLFGKNFEIEVENAHSTKPYQPIVQVT